MPPLPPLLFPAADRTGRAQLQTLTKQGRIRAIGPRLYTSVPESDTERVVRGSWARIVSELFPSVLLSHRSALEYKPTPDGVLYLTSTTNREIEYPGLILKFSRGAPPLDDDPHLLQFHASSLPRAFLENLSAVRKTSGQKILSTPDLEHRLEAVLHGQGEEKLDELRDRAREIGNLLGWQREFAKLDKLIGGLLGTRSANVLASDVGRARSARIPYDADALRRCQALFGELRHYPFPTLSDTFKAGEHFANKAFFEAYFSNYIEGTTFEIEAAEEIIFDKKIPHDRPQDAHDIIGTFNLVCDPNEMRLVPQTAEQLVSILLKRHGVLLERRPEVAPGIFKKRPNRAGSTQFVHPDYIEGTLLKGFDLYRDLPTGLARAIYIMFLVTEVHPFVDGNGRIARIMMNAELHSQGLTTIIIPNVYRDDYVGALRALSRRERPQPLVKMLGTAQKFSALEFSPYPAVLKLLQARHWFAEPDEAKIDLARHELA